jgi:hypothetical protein
VENEDVEGLYIEDVVREENGSKITSINEINIIGGNLKLHSYNLLKDISEAIEDMKESNEAVNLSINME